MEIGVCDRSGRIDRFEPPPGSFSGLTFRAGGHVYLQDYFGGVVYDTRTFERVPATTSGSRVNLTLASDGFYRVSDGHLEYVRFADATSVWSLPTNLRPTNRLVAGEHRLLAIRKDTVTAYE